MPEKEELTFISSITSTNFRKLVFSAHDFRPQSLGSSCWVPFDDVVCKLVDKLRASGSANTFDIEFNFEIVFGIFEGEETFLPKFREKGRVKFTQAHRWVEIDGRLVPVEVDS